jgi:hypothetical protein
MGTRMTAFGKPVVDTRQCAFCGKQIAVTLNRCPFCREAVPQVRLSRSGSSSGRHQIRRGLLYMLLAAIIYYFAGGYGGPLRLPVQIVPAVVNYLLPLLFLGGLGLTLYGLFLKAKS